MPRSIHLIFAALVLVALGGMSLLMMSDAAVADSHLEVVAAGLDNPRDLAFGPEGGLYVAEAGRGGAGPCIPGPEGGEICYGPTGAITRILDGEQERVATGLPSLAGENGRRALGPHGISLHGRGGAYVTVGLGADPAARDELGAAGHDFGQLVKMAASGKLKNVTDIAASEVEQNPDNGELDSNPYFLLATAGKQVVVDAGANALLEIKSNGNISTLAVFPTFPNPLPFGPPMVQAVPTSVAIGPDGAYYVGQLTGFPFVVGAAKVFRVVPGQAPQVYLDGFTHIVDLEFDDKGNLYVLQIASVSLLEGDTQTGALIRVNTDMSRDTLLDDLTMPGGMALAPDGAAVYITDCGVCSGEGSVVRLELDG